MRVVLVGSAADRDRLRREIGDAVEVIGEAPTLAAARAADSGADAYLVAGEHDDGVTTAAEDRDVVNEPLTPRELDVLELLAEGLPNKAIAERLEISDQTVKFHVASIGGKLGASNRTDTVRRAYRRGIITL